MSCISLFTYRTIVAFIVTLLRDVYEAYTLYNFLALLLCLLGGPNVLVSKWENETAVAGEGTSPHAAMAVDSVSSQFSWWTCTCCLKDVVNISNPLFLRFVRQGVMQYIFVKVGTAITSIVLKCLDLYGEGEKNETHTRATNNTI